MTLSLDTSRMSLGRWTFRPLDLYILIALVWCLYLYLSFNAPAVTPRQLSVSTPTLFAIRLTIASVYIITWLAAAMSFVKAKQYAETIADSAEWRSFHFLSLGLFLLLISLIVSTLLGSIRSYLVTDSTLRPTMTILTNYAYVLPYLAAFWLIFRSARELVTIVRQGMTRWWTHAVVGVPLVLFAFGWLETIFSNPARSRMSEGLAATYYLPDSLLVLTIILPSLATWTFGAYALVFLQRYYRHIKGILYRRAVVSFVRGIGLVILGSILLQSLLSLGTTRLYYLGLPTLILIIYLFLFVQALGFFLIARGARKLARIEAA